MNTTEVKNFLVRHAINTRTLSEYMKLMGILEDLGFVWQGGKHESPTEYDAWDDENTCIVAGYGLEIAQNSVDHLIEYGFMVISFDDFKRIMGKVDAGKGKELFRKYALKLGKTVEFARVEGRLESIYIENPVGERELEIMLFHDTQTWRFRHLNGRYTQSLEFHKALLQTMIDLGWDYE